MFKECIQRTWKCTPVKPSNTHVQGFLLPGLRACVQFSSVVRQFVSSIQSKIVAKVKDLRLKAGQMFNNCVQIPVQTCMDTPKEIVDSKTNL